MKEDRVKGGRILWTDGGGGWKNNRATGPELLK